MPEQALYLKWRPRMFEHVIGQEHITHTLRNALIGERIRHAYLFNGPRGTGKTTMARILAKAVNCLHPDLASRPCDDCDHCTAINEGRFMDLIEIDAASNNGVDDVRELRNKIAFSPNEGRYKVYIIDEVHRFSGAAFDALLKTLEEPPDHAIFILATTELDKVPPTIKSRSLIFEFRRVSTQEVANRLGEIAETEGVNVERAVLELIAGQGTGSVRDSISLLDQLIADPTEMITLDYAERVLGTAGIRMVGRLAQAIVAQDAAGGLALLHRAVEEGADPGQFGRQIVDYLRNILLVQTGGPDLVETSEDMRETLATLAAQIGRGALLRAVRAFNSALYEMKSGWQPQLPLELALVESTRSFEENAPPAPRPERAAPPTATLRRPENAAPPLNLMETQLPSEPPPNGAVTLTLIQNHWKAILHYVQATENLPMIRIMEAQATPHGVEGSTVILRVRESWAHTRLAKDVPILAKIISGVLKTPLQVRIIQQGTQASKVDDTIKYDPVIANELKTGGKVTRVDDSEGGS
ncbi:MAG TPA: DNA polymerase III subunit gamma/tau [Aggregatilineales bacterium]|nr:DNA polymerase III subunit gamma/tau [Anaerolineales bacterium]HRE47845.1 DNA polymerase III subunit gamma/tau [Aggregatilineales bacterium]